jgi:Helix-turn-helix domain
VSVRVGSFDWRCALRDDGKAGAAPLTLTEYAVANAVASYANPDGEAFPGLESIARAARCGLSTVKRDLTSLETKGWLQRTRGKGGYSKREGAKGQYRLSLPEALTAGHGVADPAGHGVASPNARAGHGVDESRPRRGHEVGLKRESARKRTQAGAGAGAGRGANGTPSVRGIVDYCDVHGRTDHVDDGTTAPRCVKCAAAENATQQKAAS